MRYEESLRLNISQILNRASSSSYSAACAWLQGGTDSFAVSCDWGWAVSGQVSFLGLKATKKRRCSMAPGRGWCVLQNEPKAKTNEHATQAKSDSEPTTTGTCQCSGRRPAFPWLDICNPVIDHDASRGTRTRRRSRSPKLRARRAS